MSKVALQWFETQKIADAGIRNVLHALAYKADRGTGACTASQMEIAQQTSLTDRTVRASLKVLEVAGVIKRRPQSKGRYGRSVDVVMLSLDRNFDLSKAAIRIIRRGLVSSSNRKKFPFQPEKISGEYNTVNTDSPFHGKDSLYLQEGTYTGEGGLPPAGGECLPEGLPSNVVPFKRGAAA